MQIAKNKVVTIDYTLTDEQGEVLDTSKGEEPLSYLHGAGNVIPGLEAALVGKQAGDKLQVTVAPGEGYGVRDESLVQSIPRKRFPIEDVEVGMQFHAQNGDSSHVVTVMAIEADSVKVDANHPLAGVTLSFDVAIVSVRDATAEEIEHGHPHGADGHDHHHDHDHDHGDDCGHDHGPGEGHNH